jgi:tetratricopeptide (TPR) repeat protein
MAREARAMAKLRHPNVVAVHEVGLHDDGVFIVMEYVPGSTLRDWLARTPDARWQDIVAIYVQAGRGLAAAHAAGLVHRDFKPDNVMVGADGRVLVTDFGIANIPDDEPDTPGAATGSDPRLTNTGSLVGTPAYMSPEQHSGRAIVSASDQFAFCAALYEALFGTRPFVGATSAEIADRASSGTLATPAIDRKVPSAITAAVRRGLASDPGDRFPSMDALLAALAIPRRSRLWLALAAVPIAAITGWLAFRAPAAEPPAHALVAVEPLVVKSTNAAISADVADVLALLLGDVDGFKAEGPTALVGQDANANATTWRDAERRIGAGYVVRGTVEERANRWHAALELVSPERTAKLDADDDQLAGLLDHVTDDVAHAIDPSHVRARGNASNRSRALVAIGTEHFNAGNYHGARPFLEQAAAADRASFEAWYELALVRSWVLAPEGQVFGAFDAARAAARTPVEHQLVDGAAQFAHRDYAAAIATLGTLATRTDLSMRDKRDAVYFLGEAHWHDGHHKVGFGYLRQALDLDLRFKPPVQHLFEYSIAHRDREMAHEYTALMPFAHGDELRSATDFVVGRYDDLARDGSPTLRLYAVLVLGQTPTPELEQHIAVNPVDFHTYRAARAVGAGDRATAKTELDAVWTIINERTGETPDSVYHWLRIIGDLAISAGDVDESRRVVEFLAARSAVRPARGYQRLSILAAPLVQDRAWVVRRDLTDREQRLADAIDAELSGDRARAAEILRAIIDDPSPSWDYPERMALLRNLRALHRDREARELCEDTMRPAIFEWSYLAARRACAAL